MGWMVVGLGNPGTKYRETRHNIGFMVVDDIASGSGGALSQKKFDCIFGQTRIAGAKTILSKPQSFMNKSGIPVQNLAAYFKVSPSHIIVVHDDIDLPFGSMKIKESGGHGGHNGIRSMITSLGTNEFIRIRLGVGRPEGDYDVSDYVLGKFTISDRKDLEKIIISASDAIRVIIENNVSEAMNKYNKKKLL